MSYLVSVSALPIVVFLAWQGLTSWYPAGQSPRAATATTLVPDPATPATIASPPLPRPLSKAVIERLAVRFHDKMKADGITGIIEDVKSCYASIPTNPAKKTRGKEICLVYDREAYLFDQGVRAAMKQRNGFDPPVADYLQRDKVRLRISKTQEYFSGNSQRVLVYLQPALDALQERLLEMERIDAAIPQRN